MTTRRSTPSTQLFAGARLARVPGIREWMIEVRTALGGYPAGSRYCLRMERNGGEKRSATERVELGVEFRSHRRRVGDVLYERDFAEVITSLRASHLLPAPLDGEPAGTHDLEGVPGFSHADDCLPRRDRHRR